MNPLVILVFGVIAGVVIMFVWTRRKKGGADRSGKESQEAKKERLIEKQAREKERGKRQIMRFFESREKITNNEIEALLGVSDATATRYTDDLEEEGLARQVGKTGKYIYYKKTE